MEDRDNVKAERALTLAERVANLELHHEETRKRMHSYERQIAHERERVDTILGSEPSIVETPENTYGR